MAGESEKRFEAIMKKLFHDPSNSRPRTDASGLGAQQICGRKRPHPSSVGKKLAGNVLGEAGGSLSVFPTAAQTPVCRPWDRGDLIRRLSTFKSITWFAKPQVVSPLECARRGWVNVDTDTIACVACNTRLLFSTPSVWPKQQVEKAAMVFSLKLDSGHNLLCPWINNSCTEELAEFPNLSRASLIEDYKKRLFSLSQLMALPAIAPMAIDNLRTPHLEQFLDESSNSSCHESLNSAKESSGHVPGTSSSIFYYQAHKLISLFGWDPRILPYRVDVKDGNESFKDANVVITTGQKRNDNFQSLCDGTDPSGELQVDPSSVVLDCKLCGASVGLWAFSTIPRPLEYIRFVGLTEVTGKSIAAHDEAGAQEGSSNQICAESRGGIRNAGSSASTSLGFTIAGGPPPALLNYGATISLPIVGHNLRARLPLNTGNKDNSDVQRSFQGDDQQISQQSDSLSAEEPVATMEPDVLASKPLGAPQYFAEGSTKNLKGINPVVADELYSSTPKDIASNGKDGGTEPQREQMSTNHEEDERCDTPGTRALENRIPVLFGTGKNKQLLSFDERMEFDPVKQHRHFCPWIRSTGKSPPGWQQTLSALEGGKELSNVPRSALIEVDDPVESVKNLFTSPDKKRAKFHSSS